MTERKRLRERSSMHRYTLQMATTTRAAPNQSQETGSPSSSVWMIETQVSANRWLPLQAH